MNRLARFGLALMFAAGLVAAATPAHAFRMIQATATGRVTGGDAVACDAAGGFAHWNARDIQWRNNTANQGNGMGPVLQSAMTAWTNVPSADHVLTLAGTTTNGFATDSVNTLVWATGNGCTGNCLALTALVMQANQVIVESDVTFNDAVTWNTDGTDFDVQAVAAHELGHSLGIHHTDLNVSTKPTMFSPYFGIAGRTLESDDRAALQCSEQRFCFFPRLTGSGSYFAGRQIASLGWSCVQGTNVDIFRNGVKVLTTPNDGGQNYTQFAPQGSANFWVCQAGSTTYYDPATCTNVLTLDFYAP